MGPWATALFFSAGASAWLYVQLQRRLGGSNNRQAAIATSVIFVFLFFISYFAFNLFV